MGMAASQSRYLFLYNRKNTIGRKLNSLSLQKQALAKEAKLLSLDRIEGVSAKVLKWSNDGGYTYKDITYAGLMNPSTLSQQDLHLVTDYDGKVVLDSKFQKYAERLSKDGRPGADWSGDTRLEILSELTGISKDRIAKQDKALTDCYIQEDALKNIKNQEPDPDRYGRKTSRTDLFKAAGLSTLSGTTEYTVAQLKGYMQKIKSYLGSDENKKKFDDALEAALTPYKDSDKVTLDRWMGELTGAFKESGGDVEAASSNEYNNNCQYNIAWFKPADYAKYKKDYDAWEQKYNTAKEKYNNAINTKTTEFTSEEENLIDFYDTMFMAIAENGWTMNTDINDSKYLNQMLQNNLYTLTRVDRTTVYDPNNKVIFDENDYITSIASNMGNIVSVSDKDAENEAMAEYEYRKSIISEKEARIDTQMKNLETEDAAIKQMLEGIEAVKKKNIETNFGIFA